VQQLKSIPGISFITCVDQRESRLIVSHRITLMDLQPFEDPRWVLWAGARRAFVLWMRSLELQTHLPHERWHVPSSTFTPYPLLSGSASLGSNNVVHIYPRWVRLRGGGISGRGPMVNQISPIS